MVDLLLPNSRGEVSAIRQDLGVTTPCIIVPNAVNPETFSIGEVNGDMSEGNPSRAGVLYAGRFEPHKNQLEFIHAMLGSKLKTTLVGPPHRDHPRYYKACVSLAEKSGGRIRILPGIAHDKLPGLYRQAKVHALPSRFETTGLVSLEAALCGCNIVTTDRGYASEYFGKLAWYCDPYDRRSIRRAVENAHDASIRTYLPAHILTNFTWAHTAALTLKAYERVIYRPHRSSVAAADLLEANADQRVIY